MIKDVHINNPSAPFSGDRIPFRHSSFRAELPRSRIFWRWLLQEKLREFAISAKLAIASFIVHYLYRSLPVLVSPRVQCVDYRNQSIREFMSRKCLARPAGSLPRRCPARCAPSPTFRPVSPALCLPAAPPVPVSYTHLTLPTKRIV